MGLSDAGVLFGSGQTASDAMSDDGAPMADGNDVSLRQRAWPFVEMMKCAQAADVPIVWGV